ncbi:MAG: helix-turn-helix domain-containing protein [Candidatus Hodarchaeota archaeon]
MDISEITLSREFKKYWSIGPKQLLMLFKLKHTTYLMKNPGLSLSEISELVGFSDQRRFNECFHRFLGNSASECRRRVIVKNVGEFWSENFKKINS